MVDEIKVFCNEHEWICVPADNVHIVLNLQYNHVEYHTMCPICGSEIIMMRRTNE